MICGDLPSLGGDPLWMSGWTLPLEKPESLC